MGQNVSIDETIFDIKFKAKEMSRMADKCMKEERSEKLKVKKAIEKQNEEGARMYAENAIRKKHEALNCLKLASRMDSLGTRLETAHRSQQLSKSMLSSVPQLSKLMKTISFGKLSQGMTEFENIFETLDVQADFVASKVEESVSSLTPGNEVNSLISEVADEYAIDVSHMISAPHRKLPGELGSLESAKGVQS